MQRVISDFLQQATSATSKEWFFATSNERILQRVTSDFLRRVTSAFLQRVTSDFLQRATSTTSHERILQRITSDFTMSNEQRVNFNEQRVKICASEICNFLKKWPTF